MRDYNGDIPEGQENAVSREALSRLWGVSERTVRDIVQNLRNTDSGDGCVIVSSAKGRSGYFRTRDPKIIRRYVEETFRRALNTLLPIRKALRILKQTEVCGKDTKQTTVWNPEIACRLRELRECAGISQTALVNRVRDTASGFDRVSLSKAENGQILLTPAVLSAVCTELQCGPEEIYPELWKISLAYMEV